MTLPSEKPATDVAAQCFLNALIRETTDWKLTEYPPDELLIPLDEQKSLHFRVAYFSQPSITALHFLHVWSRHQAVILSTLPLSPGLLLISYAINCFCPFLCETFHQRVLESHVHTQQAIDARHDWAALREKR